jgi:hypothetical protein
VTQVGQEQRHAHVVAADATHGIPVRAGSDPALPLPPGTLMQKVIPPSLVEPYLTGQRSVIAGFAHRVEDAPLLGLGGGRPDAEGVWVLRWRALQMHVYRLPPAALLAYGASQRDAAGSLPEVGRGSFEVFLDATPIPVNTEMFHITGDGEQFIARHDGQAWLRPVPGA